MTAVVASHRPGDPAGRLKVDTLALLRDLVGVHGAVFYGVDRDLNAVDHRSSASRPTCYRRTWSISIGSTRCTRGGWPRPGAS